MFTVSSQPSTPAASGRVESWVRAQITLESLSMADTAGDDEGKGRESQQVATSAHLQQRGRSDTQLEVTQVTPFRSEDATHTLYALACRKGDRQWRIIERYSGIRRIYDLAKVSYPFVESKGVPFPRKVMVQSSAAALERAEGLLLWLSSFSHVPVVADFLMGDRSMSNGAVSARTQSPVHSWPSARSRSEASTVGHQRAGHEDWAGKGEARGNAGDGDEAEAGSSSRSTPSAVSSSSRRPSMDGSGSSNGISARPGGGGTTNVGYAGKRMRVAFQPAASPVTELSACSASPASRDTREGVPPAAAMASSGPLALEAGPEAAAHADSAAAGASKPAGVEDAATTPPAAAESGGAGEGELEIFDRTPSQAQTISSELHRLLNSSSFWRAGRLMGAAGGQSGAGAKDETAAAAHSSGAKGSNCGRKVLSVLGFRV